MMQKAKKKLKTEDEQLESWANNLIEGTWAIPDTAEAIEALEKLINKYKQIQV